MLAGGKHRWLLYAALIVAIEYAVAMAIGLAHGFPYRIPFASYALVGATFGVLGGVAMLLFRLALYAREGERHPIARLRRDDWSRLTGFFLGILLITMQMAVLMWTKTMMPLVGGFWADPPLAEWDALIFGADPWIYSHAMPAWASRIVDQTYVTWAWVKFAFLFALLLAPASLAKGRLMLTYFLMVASAALGQYLAPSAGPIFYDMVGHGARFTDLPIEPWAQTARDYLWADYMRGGGQLGGGISAMPSLHVGIATWCALVLQVYWPRFGWLGWLYAGLILLGSVHLGWHYALDGIVALMLLALAYWLAGRLLSDREDRAAALRPTPPRPAG